VPRKKADPAPKAPKPAASKSKSAPKEPAAKSAKRKKASPAAEPAAVQTLQVETPKAPTESVHDLVEQLRRGDLASRSAAAARLGDLGDPQACSALAEALRDPTAELACEAAAALGRSTEASALHALIAVVLNSDGYFHSTVRTAAADSLGRLLDPRSVEALVAAVYDPVGETSLAAVTALGKIGDPYARPALETAASNVSGFFLPQVQQAAAEALVLLRG
jgi:HEAT repeat protein